MNQLMDDFVFRAGPGYAVFAKYLFGNFKEASERFGDPAFLDSLVVTDR